MRKAPLAGVEADEDLVRPSGCDEVKQPVPVDVLSCDRAQGGWCGELPVDLEGSVAEAGEREDEPIPRCPDIGQLVVVQIAHEDRRDGTTSSPAVTAAAPRNLTSD